MLKLALRVVIVVYMNRFLLAKILSLFLELICPICRHYAFGDQMIFLGHLVSNYIRNKNPITTVCYANLLIIHFPFLIPKSELGL